MAISERDGIGTLAVLSTGGTGPAPLTPDTVAMLSTERASMSACVSSYVADAVTVSPGANEPGVPGQASYRAAPALRTVGR